MRMHIWIQKTSNRVFHNISIRNKWDFRLKRARLSSVENFNYEIDFVSTLVISTEG